MKITKRDLVKVLRGEMTIKEAKESYAGPLWEVARLHPASVRGE